MLAERDETAFEDWTAAVEANGRTRLDWNRCSNCP
jgi:hypothetical protein